MKTQSRLRPSGSPVERSPWVVPQGVRFGREICGDLGQAERREWWLANGVGGYAAGTIAGSLTRRYHGLLVAPVRPPLGRYLVAAKTDAILHQGDRQWPLFTNRWASGAVDPAGHVHIESFHLDGRMPVWRYALGGLRLEARVWMEPGANRTYAAWRLDPDARSDGCTLEVSVLSSFRDHHGQTEPGAFSPTVERRDGNLLVSGPEGLALWIAAWGGTLTPQGYRVEDFDLPAERERGLPDRDSHVCVAHVQLALRPGQWVGVALSLGEERAPGLEEALSRFRAHDADVLARAAAVSGGADAPAWVRQLVLAADSFLFRRDGSSLSVIAGYPWFGDWGRDTMIALPGLTLAAGRPDAARELLGAFAKFLDGGMLPNVFPGDGASPEYNTVDAALWYVEAWRAYVDGTGDLDTLRDAFPVLVEILERYRAGTRYGIREDPADGLLIAGAAGVQLTWMDAKVGDWVVTPRIGKPVEVNALWYSAHRTVAGFARRLGLPASRHDEQAARIREGFRRFRDPATGGLFDVLDGPDGLDASLRPNQLLAVSLSESPLDPPDQRAVVDLCRHRLLTSYGPRSLEPEHPDYRGRYAGGVWERDGAYHQGPVWTWLLGHYALAHHRVYGDPEAARALLEPLQDHLCDAGLGTVGEIFDGDPPHAPRGCPAQAWSVACTLEAWWKLGRGLPTKGRTNA